MDSEDVQRVRRQSRWLARVTIVLLVLTALVIIIPPVRSAAVFAADDRLLWRLIAFNMPAVFYLYALWAIRRGFLAFSDGGRLGAALAAGCRISGASLVVGALASSVAVPNALALIDRIYPPPEGRPWSSVLMADVAYLAIGVIGLALILLSRLLDQAARTQADAERLAAELDEFF
jgi:hypothetical protein